MKSKTHLTTILKLVLGVGVVWFIAQQLTLDDTVEIRTPTGNQTYTGRKLQIAGDVLVKDGAVERRAPFERCLVRKDGARFVVETRGEQRKDDAQWHGDSVTFTGKVTLVDASGAERQFRLEDVVPRADEKDPRRVVLNAKFGLASIFGRLDDQPLYTIGAFLCMAMAYATGVLRWTWLLKAQGLAGQFGRAFRLTFIGVFFNNVMPGLTGGDIVKAVMIARDHPEQRPAAVGTVIVDRVLGIVVLAAMSAVVLVFNFDRFHEAAFGIFGFLGAAVAGLVLFFSRRVRRAIRLDVLMKKLPGAGIARKLDNAFFMYRSQIGVVWKATLISIVSHCGNIGAVYLFGLAIGLDQRAGLEGNSLVAYLATVPVTMIISSIPLLPGGWGVGEAAFAYFFRAVGIWNIDLSIALSVVQRTAMLVWSLLGGVFFFTHRHNVMDAVHESEEPDATDVVPATTGR